jgi:hypothetical protein
MIVATFFILFLHFNMCAMMTNLTHDPPDNVGSIQIAEMAETMINAKQFLRKLH